LFFDQSGNLFVADMFHNRVRRINALAISFQYATIKVGKVSSPQAVPLANDGNADLILTQPTLLNAEEDAATTTCTVGTDIRSAGTCNIGADFAPTVVGNPVLGSITVNTAAGHQPFRAGAEHHADYGWRDVKRKPEPFGCTGPVHCNDKQRWLAADRHGSLSRRRCTGLQHSRDQ